MNRNLRIGDLVSVPPVQTVIRLEDGRRQSEAISTGFVFTPEVETHLTIVADTLQQSHGQGFFLQGDFGSGKSHLLACLAAWLADRSGTAVLTERHAGLARCRRSGRRFLPVDVSLVNYRAATPLERILVEAVDQAFAEHGLESDLSPLRGFMKHLRTLLQDRSLAAAFAAAACVAPETIDAFLRDDPRGAYAVAVPFMQQHGLAPAELLVPERHETFDRIMQQVEQAGFDGLVLLIDELSEFLRGKPDARSLNEDARTLQLLGEMAAGARLWIIAAVQESIERTGDLAQVTFQKIKDRFPVKLVLSSLHIKALIAGRLVRRKPGADEEIARIYDYYRQQFPGFAWDWESFTATYPVHPITISLLDGLGDLFSVHRGIVDFVHAQLAGDPQRGLPGILDRPSFELLGPDSIYDHFSGRMAEISTLHVYPRYVVPHLDEVIAKVIEEPADQALARRLVRLLVLYRVHPTGRTPDVKGLAEQVACALSDQDPSLNVQFVAEVLLDPLAAESRFLAKRPSPDNDPLKSVYEVISEEDPGKTLKARIDRAAADLADDDTRLLTEPLSELSESISWPGPSLWHQGIRRIVQWLQSSRVVWVAFVKTGAEEEQAAELERLLADGGIDFVVLISIGPAAVKPVHTAVWEIPFPPDQQKCAVLKSYFAARQILSGLRPGRASDDRLMQAAHEAVRHMQPAAWQAALKLLYTGGFADGGIPVEPVIRQLMRFDRLLEAAAGALLPKRYPGFSQIAPRRLTPSMRIYQRLLDEFVSPGKISLRDARSAQLAEAIEDLAMPLGLVEMRYGNYLLAPDPADHSLLALVFGCMQSAGPTPIGTVLSTLRSGVFGLPEDACAFLMMALGHGGLIGLLKSNRTIPLDYLNMAAFASVEAVVPGELIGRRDRETLLSECGFLIPSEAGASFGLRQQREAWQAVIQFKARMENLTGRIAELMAPMAQFSAFQGFDRDALDRRMAAVDGLLQEIKTSYATREGLERFLNAWRSAGLGAEDVAYLKQLEKFLSRRAEQYIFASHYLQHSAVEQAAGLEPGLNELRARLLALFEHPDALITDDQGTLLTEAFEGFRDAYTRFYSAHHDQYYHSQRPQPLSRTAQRALSLLRRLARIDSLDRPESLEALLDALQKEDKTQCRRNLAEELMRAPLCGCGYSVDRRPQAVADPEARIEACLQGYLKVLMSPDVREALTARLYALGDAEDDTLPPLARLQRFLADPSASAAGLLELWDDAVAAQLEAALSGRYTVEHRSLKDLAETLGGRRLPIEQIMAAVRQWAAPSSPRSIIAVVGDHADGTAADTPKPPDWWGWLHPELTGSETGPDWPRLESMLRKHFPPDRFNACLGRMNEGQMLELVAGEPFHIDLIRMTWRMLLERLLSTESWPQGGSCRSRYRSARRAAEIDRRLAALHEWCELGRATFPVRLQRRIHLSVLLHDEWTDASAQAQIHMHIQKLGRRGDEWLKTLPPLPAVDLSARPAVVILDGVPPDVWAASGQGLYDAAGQPDLSWFRLDAEALTPAAVAAQLGLGEDPLDALPARGIAYDHLSGNEAGALANYLPSLPPDKAAVMRISLLDRGAHSGTLRLHEMPDALNRLVHAILPRLQADCRTQRRRLVLTTDHGLSLTRKGLIHGGGGVFEQAVFRAEWSFAEAPNR